MGQDLLCAPAVLHKLAGLRVHRRRVDVGDDLVDELLLDDLRGRIEPHWQPKLHRHHVDLVLRPDGDGTRRPLDVLHRHHGHGRPVQTVLGVLDIEGRVDHGQDLLGQLVLLVEIARPDVHLQHHGEGPGHETVDGVAVAPRRTVGAIRQDRAFAHLPRVHVPGVLHILAPPLEPGLRYGDHGYGVQRVLGQVARDVRHHPVQAGHPARHETGFGLATGPAARAPLEPAERAHDLLQEAPLLRVVKPLVAGDGGGHAEI